MIEEGPRKSIPSEKKQSKEQKNQALITGTRLILLNW